MKILLSGIPGGGKTTLGEYLAETYGFVHVDAEAHGFRVAEKIYEDRDVEAERILGLGENVVLSWGFDPFRGRDTARYLTSIGFQGVWLDGPRECFFSSFMEREAGDVLREREYYGQLLNIINTRIADDPMWQHVNPFCPSGLFRRVDDVAREILGESL